MAAVALVAIAVATALVIAAWRFGGPESEKVPGLVTQGPGTTSQAANAKGTVHTGRARGRWQLVDGGAHRDARREAPVQRARSSRASGSRSTGAALQLALAEPDNVVVRVNGNRVELPAGTTFVVTAQRITRATS